jgi:hypothetical protein
MVRGMTKTLSAAEQKRVAKMTTMVNGTLDDLFAESLHAKRVESLSNATVGLLSAAKAGVHAIGIGLAHARGQTQKHTIKQVDRLFSNSGIEPWALFATWVPFVMAQRTEALVALDWTDFDSDDQSMLALHLVSAHGRATPLVWRTVRKSELAGKRAQTEDEVIERFLECAPNDIRITLLADRGFMDRQLFTLLAKWELDYVIRMRGNIAVGCKGETRRADEWVPKSGRATILRDVLITAQKSPVPAVVCIRARAMKEPWCLVTSRADLKGAQVVQIYGRRFTIEEAFRDLKDPRFGFGLSQARISTPERRDRLMLVAAMAIALLTVLGAAGESLGYERGLKANTSKKRTYSLLRQGLMYYDALAMMPKKRLDPLMEQFARMLLEHAVFTPICGVL